jgi:hypothetical protein
LTYVNDTRARLHDCTMRALLCVMLLAACGGLPDEGGLDEADLTVTQANRFFTTQYGPTKWNAAGHPDGCSPA